MTIRYGIYLNIEVFKPLSEIDYKVILENYKYVFLNSFNDLYKNIIKYDNDPLIMFAHRNLLEMGFHRTQSLLSKDLDNDEKEEFKLILTLIDYGALAFDGFDSVRIFKKLYIDCKGFNLDRSINDKFSELLDSINNNDIEKHFVIVKELRTKINSIQGNLYSKTKPLADFTREQIQKIYSWLSHLFHGNAFLISIVFNQHLVRNKFYNYTLMLHSGINVCFLQNKIPHFCKNFPPGTGGEYYVN